MAKNDPVIIVGAGLAGLACAVKLQSSGIPFRVLEASDAPGGRVRTDLVDGFRLDRGFQVYLSAYPDVQRILDYQDLNLKPFYPGALIRTGGQFKRITDPWQKPLPAVSDMRSPVLGLRDLLRMARLRRLVQRMKQGENAGISLVSTLDYLRGFGFTNRAIDRFFKPFFGGVFLDADLKTSASMFFFVFRMMSMGLVCLPSQGMGVIPEQLSKQLPSESLKFRERVASLGAGRVKVESGREWPASAVVVATDGKQAQRLLRVDSERPFQGVTCFYFAAPEPPFGGAYLVLNGEADGPINNLVVPTNVSRGYQAGAEGCLVSVSVLGADDRSQQPLEAVIEQLTEWYGDQVKHWRLVRRYLIKSALPRQFPEDLRIDAPVLPSGLFVCGDFLENAAINGAVVSGIRTAQEVIRFLRKPRK